MTFKMTRDVVWRFSRWLKWPPSWISEWKDFSNSKSPCGPNAFHEVWAQSDLGFGSRCGFKIFKMAAQAAILDSRMEQLKQFCISMSLWCFPSSFSSIRLMVWKEMSFEKFQLRPSWILEWNNFSNSESLCRTDASHQVLVQSDLRFGRRCCLKNFKMAAMVAILHTRMEQF